MWNDVRFALRTLKRSPGFTLVAVLSVALGIGANTAIFSLLYQVVLRSLPVRDPESLVSLESDDYSFGMTRRDNNHTVFSYPMYRVLRDRNQVFSGLIARSLFFSNLAWRGNANRTMAEVVSGNFFEVLGVKPVLGRLITPADDSLSGAQPVIVLSYSYWESHLGRDPNVLNNSILMNNHPVVVVGIASRNFRGIVTGQTPDFFVPAAMIKLVAPDWDRLEQVDAYWLNVFGRLKPGVSRQNADAMLLPLFRSTMEDELPKFADLTAEARKRLPAKPLHTVPAAQGVNEFGDRWRDPLRVLMVMVGLLLLIACANVAGLIFACSTARQREIAIRLAIGASGWQLGRQLIVESLVLTVAGGLLGLFLSSSLTDGLLSLLPADQTGGWLAGQLDLRLFGFSLAVSLVAGILFGLLPSAHSARPDLAPALKEQSGGQSAGVSRSRTRQILVAAQICLSLLLLVGAGLFTQSLVNLLHTDLGFRADRLITFSIDPSLSGYTQERSLTLFRELESRLSSLPGVNSVARAALPPFGGWNWGSGVKAPGSRTASDQYADCGENAVGPGYFRTFGIPLVAGREFTANDTGHAPKVAIISETFARYLFDNGNPLGRYLTIGANDTGVEIVGIAKGSKYSSVREKPPRFLYVPFEQADAEFTRQSAFFVRIQTPERSLMTAVRGAMQQLDPGVPIDRLSSMQVLVDDSIYRDRLIATLAAVFGVLATILAAVGLYGTVSYSVTRRTREFGIRLALGAVPQTLLRTVLHEVGWLVAVGVAFGLPLSYALARLVESQFYGIRAHDVWVLVGSTLLICLVAFVAGLLPAMRATRIDPVRALRYE